MRKLKEFSKKVIFAMTFLWFLGAIFGAVCTWREPTNLSYLLEYISEPMSVGIIGYMAKTAFENVPKIKKGKGGGSDEAPL